MSLEERNQVLPMSLFDLLSNSLVLAQLSPHLEISTLLALAATSKQFTSLIYGSPYSFRYLNLSTLKHRLSPTNAAVQERWRQGYTGTYRTEDDYYSVALRWVFGALKRRNVLGNVTTLILDGLSVPNVLLGDILCNDSCNVRILSIRGCSNMRDQGLRQLLKYIVRPSRPEGSPKLKGLYYFGFPDQSSNGTATNDDKSTQATVTVGVTSSSGAQLGRRDWYTTFGEITSRRIDLEWVPILQACSGVISFDTVLCRHKKESHSRSNIATISLGPQGCQNCHSSPEGPAFAGISPVDQLPLLSPPPLHSSSVRAAQRPALGDSFTPPFFARCRDCLEFRRCERCNVWWCEDCYSVPKAQTQNIGKREGKTDVKLNGNDIKVHHGLCVQSCLMEVMYHGRTDVISTYDI